jgi:hypothetical protein
LPRQTHGATRVKEIVLHVSLEHGILPGIRAFYARSNTRIEVAKLFIRHLPNNELLALEVPALRQRLKPALLIRGIFLIQVTIVSYDVASRRQLLAQPVKPGVISPCSAALLDIQESPHVIKVNVTLCVKGSPMGVLRTAEERRKIG